MSGLLKDRRSQLEMPRRRDASRSWLPNQACEGQRFARRRCLSAYWRK